MQPIYRTVEQGTVFQEIRAQVLIDGKNTVPVNNVDELEGHIGWVGVGAWLLIVPMLPFFCLLKE